MRNGKAGWLSQEIFPEFGGRHLSQPGLRPPAVAMVDVVLDFGGDVPEGRAPPEMRLVLRAPEEALHWGVAPFGFVDEGVSASNHGNALWHQMRPMLNADNADETTSNSIRRAMAETTSYLDHNGTSTGQFRVLAQ